MSLFAVKHISLSSLFFSPSSSQTVSVEVSYTPSLSHAAIQEEAMRLATETARLGAREEVLAAAQQIEKESTSTPEVRIRGREKGM